MLMATWLHFEDEAIIYTGLELVHADSTPPEDNTDTGPTLQEIYDSMTRTDVDYMSVA